MSTRRAIPLLLVLILAAAGWTVYKWGVSVPEELVPAWSLLPPGRYQAQGITDPFASWSPDSRSLLVSACEMGTQRNEVLKWQVGEKKLQSAVDGTSANYVNNFDFVYLKDDPKGLFLRSLVSGKEKEVMQPVRRSPFWKEVTAFTYNPVRETITLRLTDATRYYTAGTEEYDLTGNRIGEAESRTSEGIMDASPSPKGGKQALLVQEREGQPLVLEIADGKSTRGKPVASGDLGAVAWSPDGGTIVYGNRSELIALRPSDLRRVIVGRFGDPSDPSDRRYVARLTWSPNGKYLAVLVYVPQEAGDYPLVYVLDMSRLK